MHEPHEMNTKFHSWNNDNNKFNWNATRTAHKRKANGIPFGKANETVRDWKARATENERQTNGNIDCTNNMAHILIILCEFELSLRLEKDANWQWCAWNVDAVWRKKNKQATMLRRSRLYERKNATTSPPPTTNWNAEKKTVNKMEIAPERNTKRIIIKALAKVIIFTNE